MNRIEPNEFYKGLPCSVVAIGCAAGGAFDYEKIRGFSEAAAVNGNYATLRSVNEQVRKFLKVRRYKYFARAERKPLGDFRLASAVVCVLGHYLYLKGDEYYSFFDNESDKVVAFWELA